MHFMTITNMDINDYDYNLPKEYIAQTPAIPRESAKLMVLSQDQDQLKHLHIDDLPNLFHSGDIVVINNTKVFKARLYGKIESYPVELFLVKPIDNFHWLALGKPGKKFIPGTIINITPNFTAVVSEHNHTETMIVKFPIPTNEVIKQANQFGHIPIPPYIKQEPIADEYQTSFAKIEGSVAAPTAGFHLTSKIRQQLLRIGVEIMEITLHVGLGTFLPVKTNNINDHVMHAEWANITPEVASIVNHAKLNHQRIIAIGTTCVRTLEGVAALNKGKLSAFSGEIDIFIKPGFKFQIIDGMLTNFHLPKSTLIVLVSALVGREKILHAYQEAIKQKYRFYSFGDAMLIL
jgi:S-adenosylmethionine:tRNA ribosyltransferase-isomerase